MFLQFRLDRTVEVILRIFDFQYGGRPPSGIFWNMQIFTFWTVNNGNLHIPAKFRLDRLNGVGDIAVFNFQYGGRWKMQIFTFCTVYDDNLQISSRSVERLRRYCKFSIFNMAVARHFEFVKYANFNITHGFQSKSAYLYKISSRLVELLLRYRDFLISNMVDVRHFEF